MLMVKVILSFRGLYVPKESKKVCFYQIQISPIQL
ncbi:Hypothetical protein HP17_00065 [Helicobacter pylori NCTC 11637 = CCUG 17874 = ATCC 43504 = JCM 12093]|nr:Hypothetical protein HP17_00065 [Helicobacter pylori NCTC 11637 = CCUG 17874 = ATCC 43504 = JCM 12093]